MRWPFGVLFWNYGRGFSLCAEETTYAEVEAWWWVGCYGDDGRHIGLGCNDFTRYPIGDVSIVPRVEKVGDTCTVKAKTSSGMTEVWVSLLYSNTHSL